MTAETSTEISLAKSLLERVLADVPEGNRVAKVRAQLSPTQTLSTVSLAHAWDQVTYGTACQDSTLEMCFAPWRHQCLKCGCRWESQMQEDPCQCGSVLTTSEAGPAMVLLSLDLTPVRMRSHCITVAGDRRAS